MAKTLETLSEEGADAFYNGSLTKAILEDMTESNSGIVELDIFKGNGFTFKRGNWFLAISEKGSTQQGKNLLPLGTNLSF